MLHLEVNRMVTNLKSCCCTLLGCAMMDGASMMISICLFGTTKWMKHSHSSSCLHQCWVVLYFPKERNNGWGWGHIYGPLVGDSQKAKNLVLTFNQGLKRSKTCVEKPTLNRRFFPNFITKTTNSLKSFLRSFFKH